MGRGRPAKSGRRTKSGALARNNYPQPAYDRGTERVQAMKARYGEHYSTALGRAYAAGLLGDEQQAMDRYQAGKKFARLYSRLIDVHPYTCPLDNSPRGGNVVDLEYDERGMAEQQWLFEAMDKLDRIGARPWLDQLISIMHIDHGPAFLDRLLSGGRDPCDRTLLKAALDALDALAPPSRTVTIIAVNY